MKDLYRLNRARQSQALAPLGLPAFPLRFFSRQVHGAAEEAAIHPAPVGTRGKPLYDNDPAHATYGMRRCIVSIDAPFDVGTGDPTTFP